MKKQQEGMMSRFPSNIDAHLRPQPHLLQRSQNSNPNPNPSPNPNPNPSPNPNPNPNPNSYLHTTSSQILNAFSMSAPTSATTGAVNNNVNLGSSSSPSPQQRANRANPTELQMAYHDAWRVCHPDFKRPFTDLEDACERLLPYHVVADYEAEEDDKILDSDSTGQMLSRSQQWDHNIAAKVAEFTATFEKQVLAFNIISRKRDLGEFRTEEKLMIEQQLLQEERRALLEMRAEMDSRQKAAMVHGDQQSRPDLPEMLARAPIRAHHNNNSAVQDTSHLEAVANAGEMNNGWDSNGQKDEKEPSDDFLNDEETENGDAAMQSEWRGGDLDLNAR